MRLISSDYEKTVDVGTGTVWWSLYSTVEMFVFDEFKEENKEVVSFLKNAECLGKDALNVSEQMKKIYYELKGIKPEYAILDINNPSKVPPWKGHIDKSITSCADLYTTADGKNLISEVIALLEYAGKSKMDVIVS